MLIANGVRVELAETTHPGHATELAREAVRIGATLVVAAGGDGTVAEIANGLNGSDVRLGVIPLGTANVLAHELELPFAPRPVAAALAFMRTRALFPGIAQCPGSSRLFVQMLGVGFDAQVVHNVPLRMKRSLGRWAYVLQSLREVVRYPYVPIRLSLDGVAVEAASAIISKGRFYGGPYMLAPLATPGEPGFHVALVRMERAGGHHAVWRGAAAGPAAPGTGPAAGAGATGGIPRQFADPGAGRRRPRRAYAPDRHRGSVAAPDRGGVVIPYFARISAWVRSTGVRSPPSSTCTSRDAHPARTGSPISSGSLK